MKLLLATLLLSGCVATTEPARADVTYRIEEFGTGGVCSATAVGSRSLLTAAHCIKEGVKVIIIDGSLYGVMHVEVDGQDHAIVVVTKTFPEYAKRGLAPKVGDRIHWMGQPMGIRNVYGEGIVAGEFQGRTLVDGNWWKGCSGAGLMNDKGELVGVVSGIIGQDIYKLGWALPFAFSDDQWSRVR